MRQASSAGVPPVTVWSIPGMVAPSVPAADGIGLLSLLYQLRRSEWWSPSALRNAQLSQLQALARHAADTVPFYKVRLADMPRDLTWEFWSTIPVLKRAEVQAAAAHLLSTAIIADHGALTTVTTSGSTGMPVSVQKPAVMQRFFEAATLREALWHRRDFMGKFAAIRPSSALHESSGGIALDNWGAPFDKLFSTGPSVALSIFAEPQTQIDWLTKEAPDYLLSMPSNLRTVAAHAIRSGRRMPPIREVRSFGEAYDPDFARLCREVWQAKHTSVYSTQEIGIIASQCPRRPHLHSDAELTLLEVLDSTGKPCAPGQVGRVVVTSLHNFAMPLLRYELGDLAEVGEPCPCGRGLPVIARVLGRVGGTLSLPDGGRRFVASFSSTFAAYPSIVQRQIVQRSLRSVDILLVVREKLSAQEELRLCADVIKRLGHSFDMRIVYVDQLPRNAQGKFQDFRSELVDI